jgi:hypothetical protein
MRLLQERAFFKAITFQHTFASPTPTSAKFRRQSDAAGAPAARPVEADLRALERLALDGRVCDVARLPAMVAAQVLDRAVPLALLCGVALEALSDRGIRLQGTPDALCKARRALCAMVKEELGAALSVHRLVSERCRLLATSPAEQARAQQLWQGRRVLHKVTGELLFVRELRVFPGPAPRIELTCGRIEHTCGAQPGDAATEPAEEGRDRADDSGAEGDPEVLLSGEEAVSWDDFGTPDSVKLWVPALGSDDLVAAFARRACGAKGQDFPQPSVRASQGRCGSGRFAAYRGGAQVPGKAPICRQCSPRRGAGWRRGCRGDQGGRLPRRDALRSQTPRPR